MAFRRIFLLTFLLLGTACGPKLTVEAVYESDGVDVVLRRTVHRGEPVSRDYAHPLVISYVPSASTLAAISLSTEFFAPGTTTVPARGPLLRTAIVGASMLDSGFGSMAHQYAPAVNRGGRTLIRRWPDTPDQRAVLAAPTTKRSAPHMSRTKPARTRPR